MTSNGGHGRPGLRAAPPPLRFGRRVRGSRGFLTLLVLPLLAGGSGSAHAQRTPGVTVDARTPAMIIDAQTAAADSTTRAMRALDGRPIRNLEVIARNVFDPLPKGPLRFVGRLANRAHIRTRESVIREQLLFGPGDRWSHERARESMRLLRALDYLEPISILARPVGDSVDVTVETRDAWTTQPEANIERGGGRFQGSAAFTEKNVLGFGKQVSVSYSEDPIGITRSISFTDPSVGGSRLRMSYGGSRGTNGASDGVSAALPFYSIEAPWSFGISAVRRSGQAHLFQNNAEVASLSEHVSETEVFAGRGGRWRGSVLRGTLSVNSLVRRLGATLVTPGTNPPASFVGPDELLEIHQFAVEGRIWKPRFIEREGVGRVGLIEDFDVGPSLSVRIGVAPHEFGSTADYGTFRVKLDAGVATPLGFGLLRNSLTGRWRRSPEEVLATSNARWIWQSGPRHTFEAAALGVSSTRSPRNFQTVVGGLSGLRGYPVHAVVGKRIFRWNLEDRQVLVPELFQVLSVGAAVFVDGARGWGSGAEGTGWFHNAGVGIRIAPPRASFGPVMRLDVAWPLSPTRDGARDPVLSIGSTQAF